MKEFTEDEKIIARNINKKYKWMARDRDGNLYVYEGKPKKTYIDWTTTGFDDYDYFFSFIQIFSSIKWEDREPTLISDIYNPPILNDAEREYLKTILKPFREKVGYVVKHENSIFGVDSRHKEHLFIALGDGEFTFPSFDSGTRYLGMELNRKYSLDELGITYEEETDD